MPSVIQKLEFQLPLRKALFLPLVALILLTPWSAEIDLGLSRWFYRDGRFQASDFLDWIFHYGLIPAWIVVGSAALVWIFSYFIRCLFPWRRICLYLILVLGIGSGLFVHALLKDHWGRPRPKQIVEFGGQQPFRPYYKPNFFQQLEPSRSFPCGHCSMGFYFFSLILLGRHYRSNALFYSGWILTIILGGLLSFARLAQGGHFFTDIFVSALVMWWTAVGLYYFLFKKPLISA